MPGRRPTAAAVSATLLLAAFAVRCMRPDEFKCENAVARLDQCCSGFRVERSYCTYYSDCGIVYPTISEKDATCIVDAPCATIVANGICERAMNAPRPTESSPPAELCP